MEEVQLGQLLTKKEIKACIGYLDSGELDKLRQYLAERSEKLKEKGVIADYLYYMLQHLRNERRI